MADIQVRVCGRAGRITLTRPQALNAVTWDMIRTIDTALAGWAEDDGVDLVVIDAQGERAFAAGGDIVDLYRSGLAGDVDYGRAFWAEEYRLNARIAAYPKPYVALMHGFVMGGGVGISCHGSHRVVDDSVQVAMPECGIGLIPDVGGSWLLSRAPQGLGVFAGLTGYRMGAGDAIALGFADCHVPRGAWPALIADLEATGDPAAIGIAAGSRPEGPLMAKTDTACWFSGETMADVLTALEQAGSQTAQTHLAALRRQSPLSVVCAQKAITSAETMTLQQALAQEYRFTARSIRQGDIMEGIRAQVIDKDRTPHWKHPRIEDVPQKDADAMLAPLGADELTFQEETP
ncbi:MAG: enoyl-CoA hydratase/isomerase family protein [Marinibacterium sp.]